MVDVRRQVVADAMAAGRAAGERPRLAGIDLRGADLTRIDLRGADLTDAEMAGAVLYGADLTETRIWRADLSGADLRWAEMDQSLLLRANLEGTDLRCADLSGATISDTRLTGANLGGAVLDGTTLTSCPEIMAVSGAGGGIGGRYLVPSERGWVFTRAVADSLPLADAWQVLTYGDEDDLRREMAAGPGERPTLRLVVGMLGTWASMNSAVVEQVRRRSWPV